jgi:prepilin-type N-terminal cleavage/methylation domain-containing protein
MRKTTDSPKRGFTLVELLIVIVIIGILVSLIMVASQDGIKRANEQQTRALITKIETALIDRNDALLATNAPVNQTHRYLAAITFPDGSNYDPIAGSIERRAQVIAQFDFMKAELPDVFYLNTIDAQYPFIFAMPPYPLNAKGRDAFALPIGNRQPGLPYTQTNAGSAQPTYYPTPGFNIATGYNNYPTTGLSYYPPALVVVPDSGIYGASFPAMASLTKNLYDSAANALGTNPGIISKYGYDTVDNDFDGYIDNIGEVTPASFANATANAQAFQAQVTAQLAKHDHKTARSEMLYAILVEGQGPLGSAFNASDFLNGRDVADTDGDGMPEFIDAWGQPLQFYRWPIFYGIQTADTVSASDSQQGFQPYLPTQRRQLDPLDPNQLLTSVAWWSYSNQTFPTMLGASSPNFPLPGANPAIPSGQAYAFMTYFHIIIDPLTKNNAGAQMWDRTGYYRRRGYYSKFLVLSGGPDTEIGVFRLNKDYQDDIDSTLSPAVPASLPSPGGVPFPTGNPVYDAQLVNWCENQAAQVEFTGRSGTFYEQVSPVLTTPTSLYLQKNAGQDDISNHALSAPGSGAK